MMPRLAHILATVLSETPMAFANKSNWYVVWGCNRLVTEDL